ncbi:MAG: 1-deoxy-D-xylulose-5-phosphate synthase [Clostridiales bacterium]|nr:1-deoxy-D-xylulose-5-phosphate synthase [Clostridiales bacterium]
MKEISISDLKKMNMCQLKETVEQLRKEIIRVTLKNGGHLASNLGVIELTVALHYVFDSPKDKLIFDVGHQVYAHKMLTGRMQAMDTLRTDEGISGFSCAEESEHDIFTTGHSSTSISTALGLARARDLAGEKHHIVAVIGDGALGGGMALEAINDLGDRKSRLIIILNDNEMSISKNVGGLSAYLTHLRTSKAYESLKKRTEYFLLKIPGIGKPVLKLLERVKNTFRYMIMGKNLFENMGIKYLGPIDGHNLEALVKVLKRTKNEEYPVLVHVHTVKGHGFQSAEEQPERFHGISPEQNSLGENENFSIEFGHLLTEMARNNKRVCAITAGMTSGTGLSEFSECFPERFFDVGIAEQHAVGLAAGLAKGGYIPFVAIYSTFLQRAFDQIFHEACLQGLPIVFCIDRSGLVGQDGATHQGIYDVGFLREMGMTIMAPKDKGELSCMLRFAAQSGKPCAIRYSKYLPLTEDAEDFIPYSWTFDTEKGTAAFVSFGSMLQACRDAASALKREGIDTVVVNARFLYPLDKKSLQKLKEFRVICVAEDNCAAGGLAEAIKSFFPELPIISAALRETTIKHAEIETQRRFNGLDADSLASYIRNALV